MDNISKRNILVKILFIMMFIYFIVFCINNIYAYNLTFKVDIVNDGENNTSGYYIMTFSKAYTTDGQYTNYKNKGEWNKFKESSASSGITEYTEYWKGEKTNGKVVKNTYNNIYKEKYTSYYQGGASYYSSAGIIFQKNGMTTTNYDTDTGTYIGYATFNDSSFSMKEIKVNMDDVNLYKDVIGAGGTLKIKSKSESESDVDTITYRSINYIGENVLKNDEFGEYQYGYNNRTDSKNDSASIAVSKWFIPASYIEDLRNQDGYINDSQKIRFSMPASVTYKPTDSTTYERHVFTTLYDAYSYKDSKWGKYGENWFSYGSLLGLHNDGTIDDRGVGSLANNYDNWLDFSDVNIGTKKVLIRHVLKDNTNNNDNYVGDNLDIANNNEIIKTKKEDDSPTLDTISSSSPSELLEENPTAETADDYQEYFEINNDQRIIASRSTTLAKEGKIYKYAGVAYATGSTLQEAETTFYTRSSIDTDKDKVTSAEKDEYTVITYYYTEDSVDTPSSVTLVNDKEASDCTFQEVKTGDKIKLGVKAVNWTLYTLKYKIEVLDGNIKYTRTVDDLVTNDLEKVVIKNNGNKTIDGKNITSDIFGTGESNLINKSSPQTLVFSVNTNTADGHSINHYAPMNTGTLPSSSNISKLVGPTTDMDSFSNNEFTISNNAANGLRYVYSYVHYKKTGNVDSNNDTFIRVQNKITVDAAITTHEVVNHTTTTGNFIQKNAEFDISLNNSNIAHLSKVYAIFDFDVTVNGQNKKAGTLVEIPYTMGTGTFLLKNITASNIAETNKSTISQLENRILVIGVSDNIPTDKSNDLTLDEKFLSLFKENTLYSINKFNSSFVENRSDNYYKKYISGSTNDVSAKFSCNDLKNASKTIDVGQIYDKEYTDNVTMYDDSYYFAYEIIKTKTLSRIYDFKVTDCTDVNWKNVFRNSSNSTVNVHTGTQYFSGIREYMVYGASSTSSSNLGGSAFNYIIERSNEEKQTIIPVGAYKSTDKTYIFAPKLGYRISYDLKTSGVYNKATTSNDNGSRRIEITPSYYYISKDGKTYKNNITLYYKNSDGKYVKFANSGYTIAYTPNNGYRYLLNIDVTSNTENLSSKLVNLDISKKFTLYSGTSMAYSDNNFVQSWYGEFKLPNSTIAVANGGNINSPLTDGYIGVKFTIKCIDKDSSGTETTTSYNVNDSSASPNTNTTQWDYEGYLGFTNPGSEANGLSLQLEKGTWNISNQIYQEIKGTVILYDIDNRAADDFE